MTKTHDETCTYCARDGYCDFECGPLDDEPSSMNDEGECVNAITQDCDEWDSK